MHQLVARIPEQFAKRTIGIDEFSIRADLGQTHAGMFKDGLVTPLALAQRIFGVFAAGKFLF
ncbi:hypothetical protein [Noviherbaspirillum sp. UKPF54]|uniref:hypothetical protein n=1 Tax=Noviherbaspirillum sp. UKPF54 TaxID=2601898 RepID=UPI001FF049B6|nr:hypothetical protein [Noviherbaspirillum sp. UKPF54]